MIYTVKDFHIVNKAEVDVYDPADVGNLISGSSAFSKPRTSGSSLFKYCWSLAWRILSITLLAREISAIVPQFEHFLALPFFEIGVKLSFSSPVATARFFKFADILSAAF